jgi:PadR family transcriptional regulator PadR
MVAGDTRVSQLLKGVLDMCLLSIIREEPSYGYEMVHKLKDRGLRLVSEGSIYPLLSRLQKSGLVDGYLVQSSEGPARKYYRITDAGVTALDEWAGEWVNFRDGVQDVLDGSQR